MTSVKLYTVADVLQWLQWNNPPQGLSERVIAPARAWAIAQNPYVKSEDPIISVVFEDNQVAAFTAVFPEIFPPESHYNPVNKKMWWYTTLYCNPKYQGQGYGLIVDYQLAEIVGFDHILDSDGIKETVEIFNALGNKCIYTPRYVLVNKTIHTNTFKGKLAHVNEKVNLFLHQRDKSLLNEIQSCPYKVVYLDIIDDRTYEFIKMHSKNDMFCRSQEMLNWILKYPFMQASPLFNRVQIDNIFTSTVKQYKIYAVNIYVDDKLTGFYMIRHNHICTSILYIYYNPDFILNVFYSVAEHILKFNTWKIETHHLPLYDFLKKYNLRTKCLVEMKSFSYPPAINIDENKSIQGGDGDMFA